MRDPFPMESGTTPGGSRIALWKVDMLRLNPTQTTALAELIADYCNASVGEVIDAARRNGGLSINHEWVERMEVGAEGYARALELKQFLETHPNPSIREAKLAYRDFHADQINRWINGNETPPPLPLGIDEVDPHLRTPELVQAIERNRISQMLSGYSVMDVLSGRAMVDILNAQETDPDVSWSLVGDEDEDEEFYE